MFRNLITILKKENISIKAFADFLGVSEKTAHNKLSERTAFTYPETQRIRLYLLPQYNPDYLFTTEDKAS